MALSFTLNYSIMMLGISIQLTPGEKSFDNIIEHIQLLELLLIIVGNIFFIMAFVFITNKDQWLLLNELLYNQNLKHEFLSILNTL